MPDSPQPTKVRAFGVKKVQKMKAIFLTETNQKSIQLNFWKEQLVKAGFKISAIEVNQNGEAIALEVKTNWGTEDLDVLRIKAIVGYDFQVYYLPNHGKIVVS